MPHLRTRGLGDRIASEIMKPTQKAIAAAAERAKRADDDDDDGERSISPGGGPGSWELPRSNPQHPHNPRQLSGAAPELTPLKPLVYTMTVEEVLGATLDKERRDRYLPLVESEAVPALLGSVTRVQLVQWFREARAAYEDEYLDALYAAQFDAHNNGSFPPSPRDDPDAAPSHEGSPTKGRHLPGVLAAVQSGELLLEPSVDRKPSLDEQLATRRGGPPSPLAPFIERARLVLGGRRRPARRPRRPPRRIGRRARRAAHPPPPSTAAVHDHHHAAVGQVSETPPSGRGGRSRRRRAASSRQRARPPPHGVGRPRRRRARPPADAVGRSRFCHRLFRPTPLIVRRARRAATASRLWAASQGGRTSGSSLDRCRGDRPRLPPTARAPPPTASCSNPFARPAHKEADGHYERVSGISGGSARVSSTPEDLGWVEPGATRRRAAARAPIRATPAAARRRPAGAREPAARARAAELRRRGSPTAAGRAGASASRPPSSASFGPPHVGRLRPRRVAAAALASSEPAASAAARRRSVARAAAAAPSAEGRRRSGAAASPSARGGDGAGVAARRRRRRRPARPRPRRPRRPRVAARRACDGRVRRRRPPPPQTDAQHRGASSRSLGGGLPTSGALVARAGSVVPFKLEDCLGDLTRQFPWEEIEYNRCALQLSTETGLDEILALLVHVDGPGVDHLRRPAPGRHRPRAHRGLPPRQRGARRRRRAGRRRLRPRPRAATREVEAKRRDGARAGSARDAVTYLR